VPVLIGIGLLLTAGVGWCQNITARAVLDANSAYVGESVRFQIQVQGTNKPAAPDLSSLTDFTVESGGERDTSSRSSTIINGHRTDSVRPSYLFDYLLTPKRDGRLSIPSISIEAEGQTIRTRPLSLPVRKPSEQENFKLRVTLAKEVAYVGEPIVMDIVFFYGANVRRANISMPALEGNTFHVYTLENSPNSQQTQELAGKRFNTLRLRRVLVPKSAGTVQLEPATLTFEGVVRKEVGRNIFNPRVPRPVYRKFVIPSNEATLEVRELPETGRPKGFAGHIGEYQVTASAAPLTVNVGDPITLTVTLSGPPYLEHIRFPSLSNQATLTKDFQVPSEITEGEVSGNFKIFTQTIRAERQDVKEIPPIELPYFDSEAGAYVIARSKPIQITVNTTNVVTAQDAEGLGPVLVGSSQVEASLQGIGHNYESLDSLVDQHFDFFQWLTKPGTVGLLGVPPAVYFTLLLLSGARRRRMADPQRLRARKALGELRRNLQGAAEATAVLEAFRGYLGGKLSAVSGALTFKDVSEPLRDAGVPEETITETNQLFDQCEASRYAGGAGSGEAGALEAAALKLAQTMEKYLK
jgi:hypothetical protein